MPPAKRGAAAASESAKPAKAAKKAVAAEPGPVIIDSANANLLEQVQVAKQIIYNNPEFADIHLADPLPIQSLSQDGVSVSGIQDHHVIEMSMSTPNLCLPLQDTWHICPGTF